MDAIDSDTSQLVMQCMEIWGGNQATARAVSTPGLDIWVYSRPHLEATAGGDVHYVSLCGGGMTTRIILADVSGHGVSVAELAKSLRTLMRKNINRKDQTQLAQALNREFAELAKLGQFATAIVATYLTKGDKLTVCNAGHPRPLWRKAASGEWSFLAHEASPVDGLADLPLGIVEETAYSQIALPLDRGDLILFYTDALTEAASATGHQLGEAGLLDLVRRLDPSDPAMLPSAIIAALDEYRGGKAADDDVTFILLSHNAGATRRPGLGETLKVYAKVFGLKSV
jgi:phosphoserine phosphatase RsbU/P